MKVWLPLWSGVLWEDDLTEGRDRTRLYFVAVDVGIREEVTLLRVAGLTCQNKVERIVGPALTLGIDMLTSSDSKRNLLVAVLTGATIDRV
jgi:hypothetical protein